MTKKLPEGLLYHPHFITASKENELIQSIKQLDWQQVALFGQIAKRRVVHFGMDYHYDSRGVTPTQPPPPFLNDVITRGAQLLSLPRERIAEILITEYDINAGIGWHRDAPVFESIVGISLHSATVIHFRNRADHKEQGTLFLEPGSAYALTHDARWQWEHRIAPVKELRYSITLRTLKNLSSKTVKRI